MPPTQLFAGDPALTAAAVHKQLQELFCTAVTKNASCACSQCRNIKEKQHYAVRWYAPEKQQYTVAELEPLFDELRFALEPGAHFVHIIQQAELLSVSCANSLLKSLEEPPPGCHFILITQYPALILPTIYSRCVVQEFKAGDVISEAQRFLEFFKNPSKTALHDCMKEFDKVKITEKDTRGLMDELLQYYLIQHKNAVAKGDALLVRQAQTRLDGVLHAFERLPMPGSSKLFWKTVYGALLLGAK